MEQNSKQMHQQELNSHLRKINKGERARTLFDLTCETLELDYTDLKKADFFWKLLKKAVNEESESIAAIMKPRIEGRQHNKIKMCVT